MHDVSEVAKYLLTTILAVLFRSIQLKLGDGNMRKLRKQYRAEENTLTAYINYDCQRNWLACPCNDIYGGGDNAEVTVSTHDTVTIGEYNAWNN